MKDGDINVIGQSNNKPKSKINWKITGAIIGIVVLAIGVIAGIILVRQQQNISEKASGNCDNPNSIVQCPRSDGALVSCHPPDDNGNAQISLCNSAGRVEVCGGRNYCCPSAGGSWTSNMDACAVATATATATPTATPTATATATATSTSTATPTATPTATTTSKVTATATSTSTSKSTATATSTSKTSTPTSSPTTAPIPVTGIEWPTMLGAGFGIIMVLVSLGLAL